MRLKAGDKAPNFARPNQEGHIVQLANFSKRGLVIYFYPKAFTPGCTTESCDFRDRHAAFIAAGYDIVGVSPDPVERLEKFRSKHNLPFSLISDEDHSMAETYGAWGVKKNYGREYEGIIRSTIVVDRNGTIEHAWYNIKATGHADRIASSLCIP